MGWRVYIGQFWRQCIRLIQLLGRMLRTARKRTLRPHRCLLRPILLTSDAVVGGLQFSPLPETSFTQPSNTPNGLILAHRATPTLPPQTTLADFLQKNLLNLEYRARLKEELEAERKGQAEPMVVQSEKMEEEGEEGEGEFDPCGAKEGSGREWEVVQEEEIELEEQNLIDHAEQLFLEGKVDASYVNYKDIDNNSDYDSLEQANLDAEEQYFREPANEEDDQINRTYYTGIQDF